eukprot:UN16091
MAAHHVVQTIPGAFYKTIKFLDRPNPEELYFQLSIILRNLKMVLDYPEQMDEMIVIAQKFETQKNYCITYRLLISKNNIKRIVCKSGFS